MMGASPGRSIRRSGGDRGHLSDAGTQQDDHPVEAVVKVEGEWMAVSSLQVGEAVEGTPQGPGGVDPFVIGQPVASQGLAQHLDDPLDGSGQLGVR